MFINIIIRLIPTYNFIIRTILFPAVDTVLEALSYGVPVVVSGTVGAKDILSNGAGIVIEDITSQKLCEVLKNLTIEKLEIMNRIIVEEQSIMRIQEMSLQIEQACYGWKQ